MIDFAENAPCADSEDVHQIAVYFVMDITNATVRRCLGGVYDSSDINSSAICKEAAMRKARDRNAPGRAPRSALPRYSRMP